MRIKYLMSIALAVAALQAAADEPKAPQPERKILERHDQSGVPGKEVIIGTAELPPGSTIGFHTHAGDEAGYIVKGSLTLKVRGQPDRVLKAGDSFFNARGAVHSVTAGPEGATSESAWIIDKGSPLATPAP
jgi:quercetin dioxygenase-like cupin family protein